VLLQPSEKLFEAEERSFDAITLWHVLEHVHDLHGTVGQLKKILKGSGRMLIAVPNYTSLDAAIYKENWAAYDVPRHLYHFSPGAIRLLLERHGLHLTAMKPMWYDSFYISLVSNKYKKNRSAFPLALWNGLRSNTAALFNRARASSVIYIVSIK
jgi:2-polyprenyl-3-methyl-5-hydroxy-6-metoxy-1,4-benzoquinol methylase